jgi:hypothetical protein
MSLPILWGIHAYLYKFGNPKIITDKWSSLFGSDILVLKVKVAENINKFRIKFNHSVCKLDRM